MEPSKSDSKKLTIDYKKLEAELQKEIHEDELYWLRNDAKLRSVNQGTPTYEDFRQIVLAAHLRPLTKKDKEELERSVTKGQVIWNNCVTAGSTRDDETGNENASLKEKDALSIPQVPKTKPEFCKMWKSYGKDNYELKWTYLKLILNATINDDMIKADESATTFGNSTLRRLFCEEVPPEMFPEIIQCLLHNIVYTVFPSDAVFRDSKEKIVINDHANFEDWKDALNILYIMTLSKRHELSLCFLNEEDKRGLDLIFDKLKMRVNKEYASVTELDESKILVDLFTVCATRFMHAIQCVDLC